MKKRFRVVLIIFCILFLIPAVLRVLPFPELKEFAARETSCRIYDRKGNLIQVTPLASGGRREFTPINQIPKSIQKSFIHQEDRRFYLHHGIDYLSLVSAFFKNKEADKIVRGGSTITMQLAKAINQDNSITLKRKVHDILYAYRLEAKLSKKQILELYLNSIYFGANSWGVTSGARTYFGCELSELSEGQIQVLSIVPRNPTIYNPVNHPERFGAFSKEAEEAANHASLFTYPFKMPHFVEYLKKNQKSGLPYELRTSADLQINDIAQNFLREALEQATDSRITNGSLLLIDNKDASVLAWIGNANFYDSENGGQIDGVLVNNQPGSSMKPFLYALAIENQIIEPSTALADVPKEFGNEKLYIPENFNNRFNGPIRTRIALASSLNVPAVSILDKVGVQNYLDKLYQLGFESLKKDNLGLKADLGLALGAGEVSLYELVPAFSVFTRDGIYLAPKTLVAKSDNSRHSRKSNSSKNQKQVYESDIARIICSILSDKGARALGFGYTQTFQTEYPSIFKTGTSNQYQNIIALGSTKNYTIGVWMGNFAGQTVIGKTGSSLPAWVAKNIFDKLEGGRMYSPDMNFPEPEHWHKERICRLSGMKAGPDCNASVTEYVRDDTSLDQCNWHTKINGEVTVVYPPEYQQWLRMYKDNALIEYSEAPLTVITPKDNAMFFYASLNKDKQAIPFELTGGQENTLKIIYDGNYFDEIPRPFIFTLPVERGTHSCQMICGNESAEITFLVK